MSVEIKELSSENLAAAVEIWNRVVEDGVAFPQTEKLTLDAGREFFKEQSFTGVALDGETNRVAGLYILHPNNIGRCGHICNASYAVSVDFRGRLVGETLVRHCLKKARELGFGIMQFNAVVKSNTAALALYKKLGFVQLGTIPKGFLMKDGNYEDIIPHYYSL